ncbi:calpain-9 isoform X2 [Hyalella azteca]|uniref:Calpain-9 isoform X2 n=1 Tax=Hyalella azteca TaxID=294128 RepID=A0A979FIY1_HYAAZ|nr:calpain-9 isoform X2 [Hyalella azteca]
MQITNAIIWTICISIIVFICILWVIICYVGVCKLKKNNKNKILPVYGVNGHGVNGYGVNGYGYNNGYLSPYTGTSLKNHPHGALNWGLTHSKFNGHANGYPNGYLNGYPIRQSKHPASGYSSSHSNGGTTSHRVWANGGLPHKADEKFSTLSRYWSIERSGGSGATASGGSYGRVRQNLRERGQLFQDPDFPASPRSLSPKTKPNQPTIVWLRPHEICARPKFIAEGATRFDVERGEHGDCWLLQAVSTLTLTPKFLDRVVPPDQAFDHTYCGIFRFRFWQFGEWVEVVVDDRLPTNKGRLVYLHSTDPTEFWAALLEKAYAKLYGSYESLQSGFTTRALQDLTGGIVQSFPLSLQEKFLCYQVLNSAVPRSSLLVASINSNKDGGAALQLRNGLVTQHAYSVTGLARVRSKMGVAPLVRLRNPWGAGEWNGPWSERSWEWESLSERDKELLSVRVRNEGEFWMGFDDFIRHFSQLDVVHVGPDDWMNEPALHSKKPWRAVLARRRWRAGYNAGGGPQYADTISHNPQFHVQIPRAGLSKCHVVVSVTQQYETALTASLSALNNSPNNTITNTIASNNGSSAAAEKRRRRVLHPIGFAVYEIPANLSRLTPTFVNNQVPLDVTNYSTARETVTFFTLPPGDYMVVPHTQHPNCEVRFLLRILTDEQSSIWEVNEDNMVFRSMSLSSTEDISKPSRDGRQAVQRLVSKLPAELDATTLHKLLAKNWKFLLLEKPSLELAKSLVMLRDYNISGKLAATDAPPLLLMLQFWRTAFSKFDRGGVGKTSSYALRGALWEAGVTVSNKVLECLVLRFAKNSVLTAEAFVMAMVRLHLAHERYHSIDTKMKGNPLSLEEMILMTIYS